MSSPDKEAFTSCVGLEGHVSVSAVTTDRCRISRTFVDHFDLRPYDIR